MAAKQAHGIAQIERHGLTATRYRSMDADVWVRRKSAYGIDDEICQGFMIFNAARVFNLLTLCIGNNQDVVLGQRQRRAAQHFTEPGQVTFIIESRPDFVPPFGGGNYLDLRSEEHTSELQSR